MALYHFNCTVRSRSSGSNAVAIAAYNSGEKLKDEKTGKTKYYVNKRDTVIYDAILLPDYAPERFESRQKLWNAVEQESNRKDSQLCRTYNIACQREFTRSENIELLRKFCEVEREDGKCVDLCVHDPGFCGRPTLEYLNALSDGNLHAHIQTTMTSFDSSEQWNPRRKTEFVYEKDTNGNIVMEPVLDKKGNPKLGKNGQPLLQKKRIPVIDTKTGKQKIRKGKKVWKRVDIETDATRWNSDEYFEKERSLWEKLVNDKFQEKYRQLTAVYEKTHSESDRLALLRITDPETGGPIQISRDSYEKQGLDKIPSIHLGYKAAAMEERGIKTERGDINREIAVDNSKIIDLTKRSKNLTADIEVVKKERNDIHEKIENEKTLISALQNENDYIGSAIQLELKKAEDSIGATLSDYERKELEPLCEKYVISKAENDRLEIQKVVKNIQTERNAIWLVGEASRYFTGALDTNSWNRLFAVAKNAYRTDNFDEFCTASIDELSKNIPKGNAPKVIVDSIHLIKTAVGRNLSHSEFCKVAKYQFNMVFDLQHLAKWMDKFSKYSAYKQGQAYIASVMDSEIPNDEKKLRKLQSKFRDNRVFISCCNERYQDVDEQYIDPKAYDNKAKAVDQALKTIADDKKVVIDFEEKVKLFTQKGIGKMPNATAITVRTEQLNSIVDEYEVTKQCMRRLEITSRDFWLSREKSMKQVDTELEEEQRRIKEAEEQLENAKNQELDEKKKENEALQDRLRLVSLAVEQIDQQKKEDTKRKVTENQGEESRVQGVVVPVENTHSASNVDKHMKESLVALPEKPSSEVVCEEIGTEKSVIQKQKAPHRTIRGITLMSDFRVRKVSVSITWEDGKTTTYSADKYNQMWAEHCEDIQSYNGQVNEKRRVTPERLKGQIDDMIAYTLEKQRGHVHGHGPKR